MTTDVITLNSLTRGGLDALVDELDKQFPDIHPELKRGREGYFVNEVDVAYKAGQVSIIRLLKQKLED
tara:strand:+ start:620 stop:823 length:204 start_codon:yes stop_codon:yes gene_type:complete